MKKSEYIGQRKAKHSVPVFTGAFISTSILEHVVANEIEAAEAAGVVWDPEEPELPERIEAGVSADIPGHYRACFVPDNGVRGWVSPEQQAATFAEAARRYNLLPKLYEACNLEANKYASVYAFASRVINLLKGDSHG